MQWVINILTSSERFLYLYQWYRGLVNTRLASKGEINMFCSVSSAVSLIRMITLKCVLVERERRRTCEGMSSSPNTSEESRKESLRDDREWSQTVCSLSYQRRNRPRYTRIFVLKNNIKYWLTKVMYCDLPEVETGAEVLGGGVGRGGVQPLSEASTQYPLVVEKWREVGQESMWDFSEI